MKKILILTTVMAFMATTINLQAADCSNYKTFSHKWNMCKVGKLPGADSTNSEVEINSESSKFGWLKNFFNKIRTFGGKSIGTDD